MTIMAKPTDAQREAVAEGLRSTGYRRQPEVLLTRRHGVAQSHRPFNFVLGFAMGAGHTERHERHHA
jgi:hypothetical protein